MRHTNTLLIAAALGCSSDSNPAPLTGGECNPILECCPGEPECATGEEGEAEGSPAGEGEGEGGSTAVTTGGPSSETVTATSGDDTTTGETSPSETTTSATDTTTDAPDLGVGSSSTGDACPDWGQYQCRGWVAGIYCREDDLDCNGNPGFGPEFLINGVEYYECVDDITICVPYAGEVDSAFLFDECRAECESMAWVWPDEVVAGAFTWHLQGTRCVFANDGNNGFLQWGGVVAGTASCEYFDEDPETVYVEPCTNAECQDTSECEDWAGWVDTKIESEQDERENVIYTTVGYSLWHEIQGLGGFAHVYACEEGTYHEYINGGLHSWKVKDAYAGELFYELGFRTGDQYVQIAWLGTPTVWTSMDSYEDMAAFYSEHHDKVAFKIQWLRGLDVYTMYLSQS